MHNSLACSISLTQEPITKHRPHAAAAMAGKPGRLNQNNPRVALVLGVLLGLGLPPVIRSLLGSEFFSSTCVSLCPEGQRNALVVSGEAPGPFSSFIYPTWPASELSPAVRSHRPRQRCTACTSPPAAAAGSGCWRRLRCPVAQPLRRPLVVADQCS